MVIFHYEDLVFNEKNISDLNVFLKAVGCEEEIIFLLDSSLSKVATGEKRADKVAILSNGDIAVIECEYNHPKENAIKKHLEYSTHIIRKMKKIKETLKKVEFKKPLSGKVRRIMIIIKPKSLKNIPLSYNDIDDNWYIETFSPKIINGEQTIKNIEREIKNNEKLNDFEYYFLGNPLHTTFSIKPHEMLIKAIKAIRNLKLDKNQNAKYYIYHREACNKEIPEKYKKQVEEELNMTQTLVEKYDEEKRKEGRIQGRNEVFEILRKNGASEELIQKTLTSLENTN